MSAIVSINAASERDDQKAVERELSDAFYDYWRGWENHSFDDPDYVYAQFLERRIRALETSIRQLLTSGVLTESQRTGLLLVAYGSKTGTLKDANLLTATETRLIEKYRRIDSAGRAALRGLLDSLLRAADKAAAATTAAIPVKPPLATSRRFPLGNAISGERPTTPKLTPERTDIVG